MEQVKRTILEMHESMKMSSWNVDHLECLAFLSECCFSRLMFVWIMLRVFLSAHVRWFGNHGHGGSQFVHDLNHSGSAGPGLDALDSRWIPGPDLLEGCQPVRGRPHGTHRNKAVGTSSCDELCGDFSGVRHGRADIKMASIRVPKGLGLGKGKWCKRAFLVSIMITQEISSRFIFKTISYLLQFPSCKTFFLRFDAPNLERSMQ